MTEDGSLPLAELRRHATRQKMSYALRVAQRDDTLTSPVRAAVDEALSLIVDGILDPVDVHHPSFIELFDLLISNSILTTGNKTSTLALSSKRWSVIRSISESENWPQKVDHVNPSECAEVRKMI